MDITYKGGGGGDDVGGTRVAVAAAEAVPGYERGGGVSGIAGSANKFRKSKARTFTNSRSANP